MVNPIYQQGEELLLNQFGSKYLGVAAHTNVNSNEFIVQEDAVISVLTGGDSSTAANDVDYEASMSLSGVTLKQGALIVAPQGESFQSMTIDSGTIMAYNSVVGGTKPSAVPLLLDLYPDAAAAYSLRKLRTDYTGPAIEVIKIVGGATSIQDIGFVNGELDTTSLLSFANGGDVFVAKWYDQSTNGFNVFNNAESAQPQIVSSGVVELDDDGNNTLKFSANQYLNGGDSVLNMTDTNMMSFAVSKVEGNGGVFSKAIAAGAPNRYGFLQYGTDFSSILTTQLNNNRSASTAKGVAANRLYSSILNKNSNNHELYLDGTLANSAVTNPADIFGASDYEFYIGAYGAARIPRTPSFFMTGTISHLTLYFKNDVSKFNDIQSFINTEYSIYQ